MNTKQKILINCQDGTNNIERATISFILAVTASKTCETAIFVSSNASELCLEGGCEGIAAEGYESIKSLLTAFIGNGGKLWLCPACAKAKGITDNELMTGVEIAGAPKTMAFLASGAQLLA